MLKRDKGITLVSLVVTIVILLILASITLYSINNENGIISKSKSSKELTEISQEKEALNTSIVKLFKNKKENSIEKNDEEREKLEENLEKFTGRDNVTVSFSNKEGYIFKVVFEDNGREYYITKEGDVVDSTTPKYTVCVYFENIENSEYSIEKTKTIEIKEEGKKVQISNLVSDFSSKGVNFSHATIDGNNVTEFNEEKDKTINLYFNRNSYTLDLEKGDNIASVSGAGTYKFGESIEISATLSNTSGNNINFEKWESSDEELLTSRTEQNTTIKMPNGDVTLTATAATNVSTYTIEYVGNGATGGKTSTSKHTYGIAKNLTANGFIKTGYAFTGWNTKVDGTGTSYTDRQSVVNLSDINGDKVILYAQWTVYAIYTIEYNGNGATEGTTASSSHTYGIAKNLTTNGFIRTGYTFTGWNTKADGTGTNYANEESVINLTTVNESRITLYAQWTENTYIIAFNSNGGTGTMSSMTGIKYTANVTLTTNTFTRTGYTFNGWNTKADGTGTAYADKATVKSLATSGTITLYAQWTENTYIIAFNSNGGTGTMSSMTGIKYTANVTLTANTFTRTGYTFSGWNTKADGTGTAYVDKATVKSLATSGTVTLYAQWTENTYIIAFNSNGGTGTMSSMTGIKYTANVTLTANTFTRTGYTFSGWNTKADGTGTAYVDKATVKSLATSGTITLYAQWTANTYTIEYNGNGSTGGSTANSTHTYDVAKNLTTNGFTRTGYTFNGWNTKADGTGTAYADKASVKNLVASGTITLYAQWKNQAYTVTYNYSENGGTAATKTSASVSYNDAIDLSPTATKSGYIFVGWNTNKDATDKLNSLTMGTNNVTLYAIYSKTVTVTCNYYNNQSTTAQGTMYNKNTSVTITLPTIANQTVSNVAYTPRGWSTSDASNATVATTSGGSVTLSANATYYASYQTTITGTFYYYTGSARTSKTATATRYMGYKGAVTQSNFTVPRITTLSGYTQRGWATTDGAQASVITPTTANTQFYMSYSYTVELTYNVNGGNTTTINKTSGTAYMNCSGAKTGVSLTITNTTVSRTGHTFAEKWNTSSNGTGTSYNKGTAYTFTASATLYAQWTPITYTISYNANGGSGAPAAQTKTYGQTLTLSTTIPTRGGFTFLGWSTSATATTATYAAGGSYTTNAGTTLYAVWQSGSINEDFEDTNIDPNLTLSSSNYSVSGGRYVVTSWSSSGMTTSASAEITFVAAQNGTLTFDYGEVGGATYNFSYKITLKNVTDGTSTELKNVGQVASSDHNGSVSTSVTAGKKYTILLENTSYSIYGLKPYIDNLKVQY